MGSLRKILLWIDDAFETFAILALLSMILIVVMQVFTRKLLNFVFFWSEEITLLLLAWFSFMGMAIGFREKLHLAMDTLDAYLPERMIKILDKIIDVSVFLFGVYLIVQGSEFTILMNESTMPATKMPSSVLYVIMPISGVLICAYSALQFFGIDTKRHHGLEEGAE